MLTVLHRQSDGTEVIYEATEVTKYKVPAPQSGASDTWYLNLTLPPHHPAKAIDIPIHYNGPGAPVAHEMGFVAVMNENGKTVAKYDL